MISIRNYLQTDRTAEDTLRQLAQILIAGIERSWVDGATGELCGIADSMRRILTAVESGAPRDEVLTQAERTMKTLADHNRQAVELLRRPVVELQNKVNLLTDAIAKLSGSDTETLRRLKEIKQQVSSSVDVRQIWSYKQHVSVCLDNVLAEAERHRAETDRVAEKLNRAALIPAVSDANDQTVATDPATGLPERALAEDTIAQACQEEAPAFIVVMAVNQMDNLHRSFGAQFCDLILRRFATSLREQIPGVNPLFRWSAHTIVALIKRKTMLDVRGLIEPVLLQRISVKAVASDVQVPVSSRWTVLPIMASPRLLFRKMDSFAQLE